MSDRQYLRFAIGRHLFFVLERTREGHIISAYSSCRLISSVMCQSRRVAQIRWMEATGEVLDVGVGDGRAGEMDTC